MCYVLLKEDKYEVLLKEKCDIDKKYILIKSMKDNAKNYNVLLNDRQIYL